jgi:chromate reductase, NAD(P)H dehydrogenase (quinone)
MESVKKKNILTISGSTRKNSTNYHLIKAIEELSKDIFTITVFEGIAELPHFNPDDNNENVQKKLLLSGN